MISGKAMVECGTGSTVSTWMFDPNNDIGMIFIRSKEPTPNNICPCKMPENYNWNDAEVKLYFHNVESLKSVTSVFTELIEVMSSED